MSVFSPGLSYWLNLPMAFAGTSSTWMLFLQCSRLHPRPSSLLPLSPSPACSHPYPWLHLPYLYTYDAFYIFIYMILNAYFLTSSTFYTLDPYVQLPTWNLHMDFSRISQYLNLHKSKIKLLMFHPVPICLSSRICILVNGPISHTSSIPRLPYSLALQLLGLLFVLQMAHALCFQSSFYSRANILGMNKWMNPKKIFFNCSPALSCLPFLIIYSVFTCQVFIFMKSNMSIFPTSRLFLEQSLPPPDYINIHQNFLPVLLWFHLQDLILKPIWNLFLKEMK